MSLTVIDDDFEKLNFIFKQISTLLLNINEELIWEGTARNKFDQSTENIRYDFDQLFHKMLNLKNQAHENSSYQNYLYL